MIETGPVEVVFVDTSAFYAVLDADDLHHAASAQQWGRLWDSLDSGDAVAITHHAVVVETSALVQHRLGMAAVRDLHDQLLGPIELHYVDASLHRRAVSALLAADRRTVSLADWTSFELMRELGVTTALAFDDDFASQGFESWS